MTGGSDGAMTTSTVYATSVYTITSCAATVTDCPARLGHVTTETIALYTTVCPVSGQATTTSAPYEYKTSYTSTFVTTVVYTVTSCAPAVTDCPAKLGKVTTEVLTSTVVVECTPSVVYSVRPSGTGSVVKTTAGSVITPSVSPIFSGAVSGVKAGSMGVVVLSVLVALLI
jgi:chitinase